MKLSMVKSKYSSEVIIFVLLKWISLTKIYKLKGGQKVYLKYILSDTRTGGTQE